MPRPVRQRRVDVQRLLRDALLRVGTHVLQRAHVVRAVGQFDQDDPDVLGHRDQHLAEVLRLLLLDADRLRGLEGAKLGDALDQSSTSWPNSSRISSGLASVSSMVSWRRPETMLASSSFRSASRPATSSG